MPERCEVKGFDGELVQLSCSSGTTNHPIGFFNEADQQTLKKWASDKAFMSSSKLRIQVKEVKKKEKFEEGILEHKKAGQD